MGYKRAIVLGIAYNLEYEGPLRTKLADMARGVLNGTHLR